MSRAATSAFSTPGIVMLLLVVATVLVALAAIIFASREFAGSGGRDA